MTSAGRGGLFGHLFDNGGASTGDDAWLQAMLDTEAALVRCLERAGLAARGAGDQVAAVARADRFDVDELGRQAALTGNPVPGLVRALSALLPPKAAAAVHKGATSQDIMDCAAMLIARTVLDGVLSDLALAAAAAARLAAAHRGTLMIGRTLLQQAVPVTFGLVAAGWLTSIDEARQDLARVRHERLAVQLGGAAGTLASLGTAGPVVAEMLAEELGLALPVLPWHTDRLRIIELAAALAGAAAALGKIARDVTLLAQSEVAEVREGDGGAAGDDHAARGGSSAMPHKHNPVSAVVILGCTRQVPGLLATLTAAAEQEHQRAAGAWHAEWEPLSDLLALVGSAASWAAQLLGGLQVDAGRMRANLDAARGLPLAENAARLLAPALGRLPAHDLIAQASARAVADDSSLGHVLLSVPALAERVKAAGVSREQIESALEPSAYLGATGYFIGRALAAYQDHERSN
jgi:3-carboxy-cis,cis-muconate cycloisomerase